ncbi:hypothetical protein SH668x_002698 [Planctomicrobium sp. SH668]
MPDTIRQLCDPLTQTVVGREVDCADVLRLVIASLSKEAGGRLGSRRLG